MLSYWIEGGLNTQQTRIWVKIPYIPPNGSVRIVMIYGNFSAQPMSNLSATFLAVIPNLVVAYSMDAPTGNTLVDKSGNNLHGVIYGAQWVAGARRYALQFDGYDDFVEIPELNLGAQLPITIVTRASHTSPSGDTTPRVILGTTAPNLDYAVARTVYGESTKRVGTARTQTNSLIGARSTTPLTPNIWYHIASIITSNAISVYLNGSAETVTSFTYTTTNIAIYNVNAIGRYLSYYYAGLIEGLRIYNAQLTQTQIALLRDELPFEVPTNAESVGKTIVRKYAPNEPTVSEGIEYEIDYNGWRWARNFIITNNTSSALTDFQVLIITDTRTPIQQNKMRADGADIRFLLPESINNTVRVAVQPPEPPIGHMILSAATSVARSVMPPVLEAGVTITYEMLAQALNFGRRLVSALGRFLTEGAKVERAADAKGYFASGESAFADAQLYFVPNAAHTLADARAPFGTEVERAADAKGYFAFNESEAIASAMGAFATLAERYPSALVYFGNIVDRTASAQGVNVHISDVNKVAEFIANYIPRAWSSKEWSVTAVILKRGEARKITFPDRKGSNVLKGILYISAGEWWLETVPNDAEYVIVYNTQRDKVVAFVYCLVT